MYNGRRETKSDKRELEISVGCLPACDIIYVSDNNDKSCNSLTGVVNFSETYIN
jgi:hypothetical protein